MEKCSLCEYERAVFPLVLIKRNKRIINKIRICNVCYDHIKLACKKGGLHFCETVIDETTRIAKVMRNHNPDAMMMIGLYVDMFDLSKEQKMIKKRK